MRIGDDRRGPVRQNSADELAGRDERGFQMDVGVDEAGANDLAADIILHLTGIVAHADDLSLGHGNIPMAKLIGKHIDVRGILQHKICLPAARGDFDQILLFHQLPLDPGGVGFVGIGHAQHPFVPDFCGGGI